MEHKNICYVSMQDGLLRDKLSTHNEHFHFIIDLEDGELKKQLREKLDRYYNLQNCMGFNASISEEKKTIVRDIYNIIYPLCIKNVDKKFIEDNILNK